MFVTPDTVLGMIEVKSKLSGKKANESALNQLAESVALCAAFPVWTGLFVHEAGPQVGFCDGPDASCMLRHKDRGGSVTI